MKFLKKHITPMRAIVFLALMIVVGSVGNVVFIQQSVEQVVLRREKEQSVAVLRTKVSSLEASYIKETKNINADLAIAMGYTTPAQTIYVERTALGQNTVTIQE